jgi:hypothetical protein
MKLSASILALALLVLSGFAAPLAAETPTVDLPTTDTLEAPAQVEETSAGELLGLDNPLAAPEAQERSCQYTCPNGNPFLCPAFPDRPFPSCVGGCCVYI